MVDLNADQIVSITLGILAMIPAFVLFRKYKLTQMTDFLLFSLVFVSTTIASFSNALAFETNNLVFYMINVGAINFTFLCLLLHGLHLKWSSPPKIHQIISWVWFGLLTLLILFWKVQEQPDRAKVIFMEMPYSNANFHPDGAGIHLSDGTIIYSTSFYLIGHLFWLYATIIIIHSYGTIKLLSPDPIIKRAYRYWMIAWTILLVWIISLFPWIPKIELVNLFLLVLYIFIIYLSLTAPESLLISHVQVLRAVNLTNKIRETPESLDEDFGMESLVNYVNGLSEDVFES